jgi:hypothetical protein
MSGEFYMDEFLSINRSELEIKLPNQEVRISQIISLAMLAGVIIFSMFMLYMYSVMNSEDYYFDPETSISPLLTKVLIIIGLINYSLLYIIPKFVFSPQAIKNRLSTPVMTNQNDPLTDSISKLVYLHRTYMLIKISIMEFVALFGLVVLFLSIQEGLIYTNSDYWLLFTPTIIMIIYIIKNFPTKQKIAEQLEENFLKPLRSL